MTITLELPPELEVQLAAEARGMGVTVAEIVKAHLLREAQVSVRPQELSAKDIDEAFEEIANIIPENTPPIPGESLGRESIYTREDEWNRR